MGKRRISLAQAEYLIFNKIIYIESKQLPIKRRSCCYSVVVDVDDQDLLQAHGGVYILFSSVNSLDIVDKDAAIFINNYRLPKGMLTTSRAKVRDASAENQDLYAEHHLKDGMPLLLEKFSFLRRALVGVYLRVFASLSKTQNWSDFTATLVDELAAQKHPPKLRPKGTGYLGDDQLAWYWLGHFTRLFFGERQGKEQEYKQACSDWMKNLDPKQFSSAMLAEQINSAPALLQKDSAVILGYYLSFNQSDKLKNWYHAAQQFTNALDAQYLAQLDEVYFWFNFFVSFFDEKIDFIYPIKAQRNNLLQLEQLALSLAISPSTTTELFSLNTFTEPFLADENAILAHYQLKRGKLEKNTKVISEDNLPEEFTTLYQNSLLFDQLSRVGVIYHDEQQAQPHSIVENYILFGDKFNMRFNQDTHFFCDQTQLEPAKKVLSTLVAKNIVASTKPLAKLVPSHKKILFGVVKNISDSPYLDFYADILKTHQGIKKLILVWKVSRKPEEIHSMSFNDEKTAQLARLQAKFLNTEIALLVKNNNNPDSKEIIRLIGQHLHGVKLKNIEVVRDNFTKDVAKWLVDATNDFVIKSSQVNYFYLDMN